MKLHALRFLVVVLAGLQMLPGALQAQDQEQAPPPLQVGGFETQGSADFGYRFTDIKGYAPKYRELFNLEKGPRLMDFSLFGRAQEGNNRFADDYSLTMSGLGGDPFPGGQLTVRKNRLYDLRVNYRQSYYYWNRNDNAVLPAGIDGLTTNHDWATVRKFGSVNFLLHATNRLRFGFEYYRTSRDGVNFTTRSLDYFGSPDAWGFFARANPYYVEAPLTETANRFTGGVDYSWQDWAFHYRLGYQTFESSLRGNNLLSPQRSINIDSKATASELVNNISWSEFRQLKTPVSEFSYNGQVKPGLQLRGGYIFYRYRGPAKLDAAFDGTARTNPGGTQFAPYAVSLNTRAKANEPSHVIDQGFTVRVKDWWNVLVDYRYLRNSNESLVHFHSLANGATVAEGDSTAQLWRIGVHRLDFNLEFLPTPSLVVRTGVRLLKNDIDGLVDGEFDDVHTKRIKTVWPTFSVYYQPSKIFSVRADVDEINNGISYTRVTPHTDVGSRMQFRFRPTEKFYIEDSLVLRNRKLRETSFQNNTRSNALLGTYEFNERFSIFGGISYDSFFATDSVTFIRGAPPLDVVWRDQTVNRVWQAGLTAKPHRRLGFTFAGNYLRTTGRGEISGEKPYYGPVKFPYGTGSVYYDFPKLGRLSVDLQRTYYSEQITTGDNFSANLLTIRWSRNF